MKAKTAQALVDHLWAEIDQSNGPDGCWPWMGAVNGGGYGQLTRRWRRKLLAHRTAWELTRGVIPQGMFVCHTCDNPPCCNPAHLFLGTPQDNMDDKIRKGRAPDLRGELNGRAKLNKEKVVTIRERLGRGDMQSAIARDYGVSRPTISVINSRKQWRHVQ